MTPCSAPIGGLSVTGRGSNLNQTSSAEPIHQLPAFRGAAKVTDELEIPVREFGDTCELTQNSESVKRSSTNGAFPAGVMFHRLKRCVCGFIQNAGRSSVKEKSTKEIQRNPKKSPQLVLEKRVLAKWQSLPFVSRRDSVAGAWHCSRSITLS